MKISVVIPNYNHARWLPQSIQSALDQTLRPHEIIVVDDGSTDNTREVASHYPVRYIYQANAGLSAARNTGIRESTGDWIALLDADDYWLKEKLQAQAAAVHDEGFCYCATRLFFSDGHTEDGEFIEGSAAPRFLRHHNFIDPSSVLIKKELLLKVGGFKVGMPAGEDWDMWLKLMHVTKFASVPERLLMYRVTGTGMSANPEIFLRSMEDIVAAGTAALPPFRRVIESYRMRSVRCLLVAVKYRDKGDYANSLRLAWRAFRYWPSPFYDRTFRFLLTDLRRYLLSRNDPKR